MTYTALLADILSHRVMLYSRHFHLISFMGEPLSFGLLSLYTTQWFPFMMPTVILATVGTSNSVS